MLVWIALESGLEEGLKENIRGLDQLFNCFSQIVGNITIRSSQPTTNTYVLSLLEFNWSEEVPRKNSWLSNWFSFSASVRDVKKRDHHQWYIYNVCQMLWDVHWIKGSTQQIQSGVNLQTGKLLVILLHSRQTLALISIKHSLTFHGKKKQFQKITPAEDHDTLSQNQENFKRDFQ